MLSKFRRYSESSLRSLGLGNCNFEDKHYHIKTNEKDSINDYNFMCGQFKAVIDALFSCCEDNPTLNTLLINVSPSAPKDIVDFANLVLHAQVPALKAAPDSETAFNLIFPRNGDFRTFEPFSKAVRSFIDVHKSS